MIKNKKKIISNVRVYIQASFNNTLVYVTDYYGNTLAWTTAGEQGFKGSRKSTPYAASMSAKAVAQKIQDKYSKENNKISAEVFVTGPAGGSESAIRALGDFFSIEKIANITGIPHNGCRPKKERRV